MARPLPQPIAHAWLFTFGHSLRPHALPRLPKPRPSPNPPGFQAPAPRWWSRGARPGGGTRRRGAEIGSGSAEDPAGLQGLGGGPLPRPGDERPCRALPAPPLRAARAPGGAADRAPGRLGRDPELGAHRRSPRGESPAALLEEHRLLVSPHAEKPTLDRPMSPLSRRAPPKLGLRTPPQASGTPLSHVSCRHGAQ